MWLPLSWNVNILSPEAAKTKEDLLEAGYVYDLYTTYDSYGALGEMYVILLYGS